ncbi:TPA: efflux RND transporter periplasmic adaptor subunit [Providencia rettgeri]
MFKYFFVIRQISQFIFSIVCLVTAVYVIWLLWQTYENTPWTRDAKVVAQVVRLAPEVSGTIDTLSVKDNQRVLRGEELYRLDQARFKLAVKEAETNLDIANKQWEQKNLDAKRRNSIRNMLSQEEVQQSLKEASIAHLSVQKAAVALSIAKLNLDKSIIRAPVSGYITHLRIQQGDYATVGQPNLSLVNADSFMVMGYFEETKLNKIKINAPVSIQLMAYSTPLKGHVESIGYGITDENQHVDEFGLPHVNPSFNWIRLAQRIPVRVIFDELPRGIHLTTGLTASVEIETDQSVQTSLMSHLFKFF